MHRHRIAPLAALALLLAVTTLPVSAQVPGVINYQGRISAAGTNFTGSAEFKYALVNSNGSISFWSNDGTSTGGLEPTTAVSIGVSNGLYSVLLGNTALANMTPVPAAVFTNSDVRLRIWFRNSLVPFQLLSPDQRLAAVGYAMNAATFGGQSPGAFLATTGGVVSGAVTFSNPGNSFQGSYAGNGASLTNLAGGAIAAGSIGSNQIANGSLPAVKLAKPPQSGTVDGSSLFFSFGSAPFSVSFNPVFGSLPVVTLALETASSDLGRTLSTMITNRSTTGFSGLVQTPVPAPVTVLTNVIAYTSSLAVGGDGNPCIAFVDYASGDLSFVRGLDTSGVSWATRVALDTNTSAQFSSHRLVNGASAIAYFDGGAHHLKYIRASNSFGSVWLPPVVVDNTATNGMDPSMIMVNGNPGIAYLDYTHRNLRYVRAANSNGTAWGAPQTIDTNAGTGYVPSLAMVNGNPAVAYYDSANADLKYVRASNSVGTTWGTPITIDSTGSVGDYPSLCVVNGNPAIAYRAPGGMKFVRAGDANGASWTAPVFADDNVNMSPDAISLILLGGFPVISYHANLNGLGTLQFVRAADINGAGWNSIQVLDSDQNPGIDCSLGIVDGAPAMSYMQGLTGVLKFLRANGTNASAPFKLNWIGLEP